MKNEIKKIVNKIIPEQIKSIFSKSGSDLDILKNKKVHCILCNSYFERFASYNNRENALCLKCGSLERHRLLWKYLEERTNFFQKGRSRVLHFAPEEIFFKKFSAMKNVEYSPCDLFPHLYRYDKKKITLKVDITAVPSDDNTFDVILCNHVLEHIPDDKKAMSELYRVMKKGGWGIFQVPIDYDREKTYEDFSITTPEGRLAAFGQSDHVRWYGKDYKNRLESVGFKVCEDNFVRNFSSDEIVKYGFQANELIYYCKKE